MLYTLILKNNASSKFAVIDNLVNVSTTDLYLQFEDVELGLEDGEYTYAAFANERIDLSYDFKEELLSTIITYDENKTIELRDLNPYVGLMRIGLVPLEAVYDNNNKKEYYYEG